MRPDAKSQVTVRYHNEKPIAVETVVEEQIVRAVIPDPNLRILINPTGRFVVGGPCGDTGRKIIVDTYGGRCPHGGGAFSSKVDRSAAYAARYVAKNIVAADALYRSPTPSV